MQRLIAWGCIVLLTGCCHTCRERPEPVATPAITEAPAPYRLVYEPWPTRYIPDVVVIQGGREFVLQPEIPGEVLR